MGHTNISFRRTLRIAQRRAYRGVLLGNRLLRRVVDQGGAPIWVVGYARSGTTWLAQTLNTAYRYRLLFEPFHPRSAPSAKPYPTPGLARESADFRRFVEDVFAGNVSNNWINMFPTGYVHRGNLVKDINGHLLLPWIDVRFPEIRKILILRHPFAVALSLLGRQKFEYLRDPNVLLGAVAETCTWLGDTHWAIVREASSDFERQVAIWCMATRSAMEGVPANRLHIVFYEDLLASPGPTLARLVNYLGDDDQRRVTVMLRRVHRPSSTTQSKSKTLANATPHDWTAAVGSERIAGAYQILNEFGLADVYRQNGAPSSVGIEHLRAHEQQV